MMDLNAQINTHKELEQKLNGAVNVLKGSNTSGLIGKAMKMMMSGKFDLEALGLPSDLIETLEEYQRTSNNLRKVCELVQAKQEKAEC